MRETSKKSFFLAGRGFIEPKGVNAEKHRYLGTIADPIKEYDYFSRSSSHTMFGMILCEIGAHYGVPEDYSTFNSEKIGPSAFRISLSFKSTDRVSHLHLQNFHTGIEKMLHALAREDINGKLEVNPYEMWVEASDKHSFFLALISMMVSSDKNLTTPDQVPTEPHFITDTDYEWTDEKKMGMSEEQHEFLKNAQRIEHLHKYAQNYRHHIKGSSDGKEIATASKEAEAFLALPTKSYTRLQFEASMTSYRASGLSISMEHVLKTIYQEDCGTKPMGVDMNFMNGGFH